MWLSRIDSSVLQVETPQPGMPGGLARSSDTEGWPPKEPLDQSGSNDFSAHKEIQELQAACGLLRCMVSYVASTDHMPTISKGYAAAHPSAVCTPVASTWCLPHGLIR